MEIHPLKAMRTVGHFPAESAHACAHYGGAEGSAFNFIMLVCSTVAVATGTTVRNKPSVLELHL